MPSRSVFVAAATFLSIRPILAAADSFPPLTATAYQNSSDGIDYTPCSLIVNTQDVTFAVSALDGNWAPTAEGCVVFPYFATGTSTHFFDALSVHFDTGAHIAPAGAVFRAFVRKGAYEDICGGCSVWHQYRLYPGAFNTDDEDCDTECVLTYDSFPEDRSWSGWLEIPVPQEWFVGGALDVSLRLWNAQVDAVQLVADLPTPNKHGSWGQLKAMYR
jgi:hypothetical protein